MDYKEKYEQALERAKVINQGTADYEVAVKIFPELKKSEDEEIRYYLIEFVKINDGVNIPPYYAKKALAWLEKQKDHEDELEKAYKTADEVQYRRGYEAAKREFEKQGEMKPQGNSALEVWKDMRLEVYQQASGNRHEPNYSDDSTKMFSLTDIDEIFDKVAEKQGEQKLTLEDAAKAFLEALSDTPYNNTPITEAQIVTKQLLTFLSDPKSYNPNAINEQNPAWSEEDEQNFKGIINEIEANKNNAPDYDLATYNRFLSWLKSLKVKLVK